MNTDEVVSLLRQMHSMRPQDALDRTAGNARLLVEWASLMTTYYASQNASRLSRGTEWWFDEGSRQFVRSGVGPAVAASSLRFDADGRLQTFAYGEIPLEELVFGLVADAEGWSALGFSEWSNTTIQWFAANRPATERIGTLKGRRPVKRLGDGSCFVSGEQRHPVVGWVASLAGGAAVARVQSTKVHRDTVGADPLRLELELPESTTVTLHGTRIPRMMHPFKVDLTLTVNRADGSEAQ